MRLHILVEGRSEEAFLNRWAPRLLPSHHVRVYPHEGKGELPRDWSLAPPLHKRGLLDQLPAKLRAWGSTFDSDTDRVIVLLDADNDDCRVLRESIWAGWNQVAPTLVGKVRIAVEETEAFFLGDREALRRAFGRLNSAELKRWQPDSICGTWETLGRVIRDPADRKVVWASKVGDAMGVSALDVLGNRSPSFRALAGALQTMAGDVAYG